jgi:hypothetical protein
MFVVETDFTALDKGLRNHACQHIECISLTDEQCGIFPDFEGAASFVDP